MLHGGPRARSGSVTVETSIARREERLHIPIFSEFVTSSGGDIISRPPLDRQIQLAAFGTTGLPRLESRLPLLFVSRNPLLHVLRLPHPGDRLTDPHHPLNRPNRHHLGHQPLQRANHQRR